MSVSSSTERQLPVTNIVIWGSHQRKRARGRGEEGKKETKGLLDLFALVMSPPLPSTK